MVDVINHGLAPVEKWEPMVHERKAGGGRTSAFDAAMKKVEQDESLHGRDLALKSYGSEDSARQALGGLKRKYGFDSGAYGWDLNVGNTGDGRHTIIVNHLPSRVVAGGVEAHEVKVASRSRRRGAETAVEGDTGAVAGAEGASGGKRGKREHQAAA